MWEFHTTDIIFEKTVKCCNSSERLENMSANRNIEPQLTINPIAPNLYQPVELVVKIKLRYLQERRPALWDD